ncbi:MAG TPA: hypothetical protein ENF87_01180, partial [Thermoproteales archaeon]|nr:hypothetical protein [Thermoproteales archaeon]
MFKVNLDKVVYKIGERALLSLSFKNTSSEAAKKDVYLELRLNGELKMAFLAREGISLGPGEEYRETIEVPLPREEGLGELNVYLVENGEVVRKNVELGIVDPSKRKPLMVAFVWHHHQAPNFYPDGTFHSLWAFTHVYDDEFPPFEGGAYYIHVKNHEKHTKIKDCDHVSPSLLLQWKAVIERGAKTVHGRIEPDDPKIERVRYVLEKFREMSAEGKVEILGDLFAHTVQGLVIDLFSKRGMKKLALEILDWELRYGKRITREVLDCEPIGAWTPEMYWSPELAELYSRNGYKYTVLCDQHFRASSGEKGSIYEPYRVEYNGNSIVIFFRDRELSDWISFRNNFTDEEHAEREARGFTLTLLEKYFKHPGGICVIALDGENWMIGSMTREYVPLFFDLLWRYIEESEKVFKTVTLSEYLKNRDGNSFKTLKYIPKGSWAGLSNAQWVGGVK